MPDPQSWRSDDEGDLGAGALWVLTLSMSVLVSIVAALMMLPALKAQQTYRHGAVVALEGTPHLWIADAQGVLHWGGDTRALAGKHVNWNDRTGVSLAQLRALPVGDPWLSAGLLKDGDPIYLVKWESDWAQPRLLHIQSIADVELFGIDGSNYGRFVLDRATWEARYGMSAACLQRSALPAAVTTAIATPTPIPRPTIDPRLQEALNVLEETWPDTVHGERGHLARFTKKWGESLTIVFGRIEHAAQYHVPTHTITVDESMRDQPLEVLAYILMHELQHAILPWTKYGDGAAYRGTVEYFEYCLPNEYLAESMAAGWWDARYGEAGHPDTANEWVARANHAAWLSRQDRASGARLKQQRLWSFARDTHKDGCKLDSVVATPMPSQTLGTASAEEVDRFFDSYDQIGERAFAEVYNVKVGSVLWRMHMRAYGKVIDGMDLVYLVYTWSAYPYGTFPDTWAFAKAYVSDHEHYVGLASQWLESDPCTWPDPVQQEMVAAEQSNPGGIRAALSNVMLSPDLARYVVPGIINQARQAYYEDPEAYLDQFRCTA